MSNAHQGFWPNVGYPIQLSNLPFPCFQSAVNEAEKNVQSGPGMALMTALSAISLAAQGKVSVQLPHGSIVPCSQMILVLADSGERKSTVFNVFYKAIRAIDEASRKRHGQELSIWKERLNECYENHRSAKRRLKKAQQQGEILDKETLLDLTEKCPDMPILYRMLFEDTTGPALFRAMHDGFPYVGQISTEGGAILKNSAFNDMQKQSLAWDGAPIIIDRLSGDSYVVERGRITTLIMVQPRIFQKYIEKKGVEARASGLWARFICWQPQSMQGSRTASNFTNSWEHCDRFNGRIREVAEDSMARFRCGADPEVIDLSPGAKEAYLHYYNRVELQQAVGMRYSEARDHASKLPENAARVAASLHAFEKFEGDISQESMLAAISIVENASAHFLNVFVPPPQEETDALILDAWFDKYRRTSRFGISRNHIRQYGPNCLREKNRLNRALDFLLEQGKVQFWMDGRTQIVIIASLSMPLNYNNWTRRLPTLPGNDSQSLL